MSSQYNHLENESMPLMVHEWLIVVILITVIGGMTIITSLTKTHAVHQHERLIKHDRKDIIEVFVKGAVNYPGVYQVPSNMLLNEILDLSQVKADGDLRRFNLNKVLQKGRVINVPHRPMLTIHLKGAVKEPIDIKVPKGTRVEDLLSMISFADHADTTLLHRKRKLKNEEVILIPFQK